MPGFDAHAKPPELDEYGGRKDRKARATGFFHPAKIDGRWWLVDPNGGFYLQAGVCSLSRGNSAVNVASLKEKYGTPEQWAIKTSAWLRENGFTGSGAWSDVGLLRGNRIVYSTLNDLMGGFARSRHMVTQQPGHLGYPGDAIPVFHPEFEAYARKSAGSLAAYKEDPWLLGHFSDNELPLPADLLDRHLKLDGGDANQAPGLDAVQSWLKQRKGTAKAELNDADRDAFLSYVFDRYLSITTAAIRAADPNHLCLGPRLYGSSLHHESLIATAGKHLDILSLNVYNYWTPPADLITMWESKSGKPFLVTEWYVKGDDAGFKNSSGAGWIVPTQRDRALFYQNFTLALLESKSCVGWHWFKYMDNDPDDPTTDPSNRDSNKGMVDIRYNPYSDVVTGMRELNRCLYSVVDYFDRSH
ncbi:MAG: hypothetical protein WDO73_25010 [Ignavibacteriota bacterium]